MSKHSHSCLLLIITFSLVILPLVAHGFATSLNDEEAIEVGVHLMKEKLTHLRLYWHDVVSGPSPTSVRVVKPVSSKSKTAFGLVNMIDNALTQGPNINTKLVGRAQGLYASACQNDIGLLMAMNFAFMEGQYNGSSITILGRNMVFSKVREMAVVGGSGLFRFATGYVEARTHALNPNTGDAIVQYDCYVKHY